MAKAPNGFVRLRRADGDGEVYIRASQINSVEGIGEEGTLVRFGGSGGTHVVVESPATVARRVAAAEGGENAK